MIEPTKNTYGERIARLESEPAELLTVGAVAKIIGTSIRQVFRLSESGRMPAPVRLGRLVRWPRQAIMRWVANGCPAVRNPGRAGQ